MWVTIRLIVKIEDHHIYRELVMKKFCVRRVPRAIQTMVEFQIHHDGDKNPHRHRRRPCYVSWDGYKVILSDFLQE